MIKLRAAQNCQVDLSTVSPASSSRTNGGFEEASTRLLVGEPQRKRFMIVKDVKQSYVGTDPHEATDFINRTADSGNLGGVAFRRRLGWNWSQWNRR
jgi:hypothetical protein